LIVEQKHLKVDFMSSAWSDAKALVKHRPSKIHNLDANS
jgi:hypothetical protein